MMAPHPSTPPATQSLSRFRPIILVLLMGSVHFIVGCSSTPPYTYQYVPGRTATVNADGIAAAPPEAPGAVRAAIAAGNEITGSEYVYGGGHGEHGGGFDCSGSASYVLRAAGCLNGSMASDEFRHYGEQGAGRWISIYARDGHVFTVVAGLRFDTGWTGVDHGGPRWTRRSRPADGCVIRHPPGL